MADDSPLSRYLASGSVGYDAPNESTQSNIANTNTDRTHDQHQQQHGQHSSPPITASTAKVDEKKGNILNALMVRWPYLATICPLICAMVPSSSYIQPIRSIHHVLHQWSNATAAPFDDNNNNDDDHQHHVIDHRVTKGLDAWQPLNVSDSDDSDDDNGNAGCNDDIAASQSASSVAPQPNDVVSSQSQSQSSKSSHINGMHGDNDELYECQRSVAISGCLICMVILPMMIAFMYHIFPIWLSPMICIIIVYICMMNAYICILRLRTITSWQRLAQIGTPLLHQRNHDRHHNDDKQHDNADDAQLELEMACYTCVRIIMEMELVARGYRVTSSLPMNARRLDWQSSANQRQCHQLRRQLGHTLIRQQTAIDHCARLIAIYDTNHIPSSSISSSSSTNGQPSCNWYTRMKSHIDIIVSCCHTIGASSSPSSSWSSQSCQSLSSLAVEPSNHQYDEADISLEGLRDSIRRWLQTRVRVLSQCHHITHTLVTSLTNHHTHHRNGTINNYYYNIYDIIRVYQSLYNISIGMYGIMHQMTSWSRADAAMIHDTIHWIDFAPSLSSSSSSSTSSSSTSVAATADALTLPLKRLHDGLRSGVRRLTLYRSRYLPATNSTHPTNMTSSSTPSLPSLTLVASNDTKDSNNIPSSPATAMSDIGAGVVMNGMIDGDLEYLSSILTDAQQSLRDARAIHAKRPKPTSTVIATPIVMVPLTSEATSSNGSGNESKDIGDDRRGHLISSDTIGVTFEASGLYDSYSSASHDHDHDIIGQRSIRPSSRGTAAEEKKRQLQNTIAMVSELRSVLQHRADTPAAEPFIVRKQD